MVAPVSFLFHFLFCLFERWKVFCVVLTIIPRTGIPEAPKTTEVICLSGAFKMRVTSEASAQVSRLTPHFLMPVSLSDCEQNAKNNNKKTKKQKNSHCLPEFMNALKNTTTVAKSTLYAFPAGH